jgi:P4 family phage/plasmid primase-like protien
MSRPFSTDPEDAPIEADPLEESEDADEAEIKAATLKEIRVEDVSDVHYDKKGEPDGFTLSFGKAAHAIANNMLMVMSEESPDIYRFDGEIYRPDGARLADMKLCQLLGDQVIIKKVKEVERRIKNALLSSPVKFEPDPYLLAVKNGVIDTRTGEFREFKKEDLLLEKLDVTYDKNAKCPVFCEYLTSITNVIVDRLTLIDWFAAHALQIPIPYVMFLLGLGRNGKGIYEKLLKAFYGRGSFRDFAIDAPEKNNFAASALYRKRGWVAAESKTSKGEPTIGTELMKLITGNGVIDADRKNIGRISFEPYTQITVDTNTMPRIKDRSVGWEERLVKINLPYLFLENLKEGDPQVKIADPDLFEKLTTDDELSGILNLVIYRVQEICKTKRITKRSGKEMVKEYSDQSSSIETFLNEFCEYGAAYSGLLQPFKEVFEAFEKWCQLTVSEKVDAGYFGKQLKTFCGNTAPIRTKTKGKDRTDIKLYRGLIFEREKYIEVIQKLQNGFKEENVDSVASMSLEMSLDKDSLLIPLSLVSLDKQWNNIILLFSNKHNRIKESLILPATLATLATSIAGDIEQSKVPILPLETHSDNYGLQPGASVVGSISLPTPCKDVSILAKSEVERIREGHQAYRARRDKHTCSRCGKHDDIAFAMSDHNGYYCETCRRDGPPPTPAPVDAQVKLSEVA